MSEALVVFYTPVSIQETVLRWRLTLKDKADDAALPAARRSRIGESLLEVRESETADTETV